EQHSRTDVLGLRRLYLRRHGHCKRCCTSRISVYPCSAVTTQSIRLRRLLLVYRGQQQLQLATTGSHPPLEPRLAVPGELYMGQEPGYEFRSDRCSSTKSGANGDGSERSSTGLGTVCAHSN